MSLHFYLERRGKFDDGEPFAQEVASFNYTHNIAKMADAAGIYDCLWRPEENGIETAAQCIEPLELGLTRLVNDRAKFEAFNSPNGWGTYVNFVPWVRKVLEACKANPAAKVRSSR